jgi:hypothetical protein
MPLACPFTRGLTGNHDNNGQNFSDRAPNTPCSQDVTVRTFTRQYSNLIWQGLKSAG